jgi:hypothetical protein
LGDSGQKETENHHRTFSASQTTGVEQSLFFSKEREIAQKLSQSGPNFKLTSAKTIRQPSNS